MSRIVRISHFDVNLSRKLGSGGFGDVYRAKDVSADPPVEVAAKQMKLTAESKPVIEKEVEFLRMIGNHPCIINFKDCVEIGDHNERDLRNSAWIFMEMATGGELFDRLIDSGNLTERAVRPYFMGMTDGLLHCHVLGVVHRDIKLENVMLCAEDPFAVKLVDFGLAVTIPRKADGSLEEKLFYDRVGSKSYRAPEILACNGYQGPPVDVWALGITVFSLVSGFFPLDEARTSDWRFARLAQDQSRGVGPCDSIYSMYRRQCPFTTDLKELLDKMLTIDPRRRITLSEVKAHRWFAPKESEKTQYNGDGDELLYRSLGGDDEEEDQVPFELPAEAAPITRQAARLQFSEMPA